MRPSSSTSDGPPAATAADAVSTGEWVRAMLDVEAALARAHGAVGTIPADDVRAIERACAGAWDAAAIEAAGEAHASPVVALVDALRERVGPYVGVGVHLGATSQDVIDSAAMLVTGRALVPILADAGAAADAAAALAAAHRDTPVLARTLLQAALPTAFGLKAAGWLVGIDAARAAVAGLDLPVQMAGPVGHEDPALADRLAAELGLAARALPWQADRTPVALVAGALGTLAGALAKPARDVVLLSQTEVGEVAEARAGRSSAMAHKRNPAAAVQALAAAHRVPGLAATLLAGMAGEHERAAGVWQAERATLSALLAATGDVARHTARSLAGLEVDADRMAANLAAAGVEGDLGAAGVYVDRALRAHKELPG